MANNFSNSCGASERDSGTEYLETHRICSLILANNKFQDIGTSPPYRLVELSSSTKQSTPFRLLDLPYEIRLMIYHLAIGNQCLHIYSDCNRIPDKIIQCNSEDPRTCLESKHNQDILGFPFEEFPFKARHPTAHFRPVDELVHFQGSVLFHNRICTSRDINVGDPNGYWSLSLSQQPQTGLQTVEYGTRENPDHNDARLLDYCPCIHRAKTSLSLNLLQTCKQIHKEAALIPYSSNTFIFQNMETFTAFFGLVYPKESESNDNPTFTSERSSAIYNMRHIHLYSRALVTEHLQLITRLLRAGLSLLTGLQTFELTLGLLPIADPEWELEDTLLGVPRSVKKVTVNIGDYIWMAREYHVPHAASELQHHCDTGITMEKKHEFGEKIIKRLLKKDGVGNQKERFL